MQSAPTTPTPSRPAISLSPLAEAIIAAVSEHYKTGNARQPDRAEHTRRVMLSAFANIGVSPEHLRGLARVIQS